MWGFKSLLPCHFRLRPAASDEDWDAGLGLEKNWQWGADVHDSGGKIEDGTRDARQCGTALTATAGVGGKPAWLSATRAEIYPRSARGAETGGLALGDRSSQHDACGHHDHGDLRVLFVDGGQGRCTRCGLCNQVAWTLKHSQFVEFGQCAVHFGCVTPRSLR